MRNVSCHVQGSNPDCPIHTLLCSLQHAIRLYPVTIFHCSANSSLAPLTPQENWHRIAQVDLSVLEFLDYSAPARATVFNSPQIKKQNETNSIKQYQTAKQNNNITQDQEVRPCQANKHHTIQTDTDHMASHVAIYLRRIGHPENRRKIWDPKSSKHKFQIIPVAHRLNDFAMHMPSLFL